MSSNAKIIVKLTNNTNGYITFSGFSTDSAPNPVQHGCPPVAVSTVKNDGKQVTLFQASAYNSTNWQQTQGEAYFNMPDGSLLTIKWYGQWHPSTSTDGSNDYVTCSPNYNLEFLQSDNSYSATTYWDQTDVNTFTATVKIGNS